MYFKNNKQLPSLKENRSSTLSLILCAWNAGARFQRYFINKFQLLFLLLKDTFSIDKPAIFYSLRIIQFFPSLMLYILTNLKIQNRFVVWIDLQIVLMRTRFRKWILSCIKDHLHRNIIEHSMNSSTSWKKVCRWNEQFEKLKLFKT